MAAKLSMRAMKKIYHILIDGNPDVNFYCMCLQSRENEKAMQRPFLYGLKVLKINLFCRVPFLKLHSIGQSVGKSYLSKVLVRPPVYDLARRLLQNDYVVSDLWGSAFITLKNEKEIFREIEEELDIRGFAKWREKLKDDKKTIKEIYEELSSILNVKLDYKVEVEIARKLYIRNKYISRLFDIAAYNKVKITGVIASSYPRKFFEELFEKNEIYLDGFFLTNEERKDKKEITVKLACEYAAIVSSDHSYIKAGMKAGFMPLYYRNPQQMLKYADHPQLTREYKQVYDGICGMEIFNGENRFSRDYELSYLCIAPAVFGFVQKVNRKARQGDMVITFSEKYSVFNILYRKLYGEITQLDPDVNEQGMMRFIKKEMGGTGKVVIAEPIPGSSAGVKFCSMLEEGRPDITYKCVTMNDFLGLEEELREPLKVFMKRNIPFSNSHSFGGRDAIEDFGDSFYRYIEKNDPEFRINGSDAAALYTFAYRVIRRRILEMGKL